MARNPYTFEHMLYVANYIFLSNTNLKNMENTMYIFKNQRKGKKKMNEQMNENELRPTNLI